ncbi:MAG: Wadjet anti-phage system protein JetD domain-containing protein [Chloroflexota bacterium]
MPSSDTRVIVNALLDVFERREASSIRAIKVKLRELSLPAYFSQQDPEPRMITNQQMQTLADPNLLQLKWLAGEEHHLLEFITLASHAPRPTPHVLYSLLNRTPLSNQRSQLESLLLADKFRFPADDWRARALTNILDKLRAGKSPSPFSLTASDFNSDLLSTLLALSSLQAETPYRVFSVRVFNDTKRFDDLRPALIRLARQANPEWKSLTNEDLLRELNLVANPGYIHLSGNWQFTTLDGEVLSLNGFSPSIGFPAAQIASIQSISVHADSVLGIENLTSFYEHINKHTHPTPHSPRNTSHTPHPKPQATICLMGNPSPAIRHLLRLIPEETKIKIWSDMDYGGFNILSQLRKEVSARVQPYLMDVSTFENYAHLSRPLTQHDARNLKRLLFNPNLRDIHPVIEHLLQRGLKLEQEAIHLT